MVIRMISNVKGIWLSSFRTDRRGAKNSAKVLIPSSQFSSVIGCQPSTRLVSVPPTIRLRMEQPIIHGKALKDQTSALFKRSRQVGCKTSMAAIIVASRETAA